MDFDPEGIRFWITVCLAAAVKLALSETLAVARALITFAVAIYLAWAFTDFIVDLFDLNYENRNAVAALVALLGEQVVRWIMNKTPEDFFKLWRGKK